MTDPTTPLASSLSASLIHGAHQMLLKRVQFLNLHSRLRKLRILTPSANMLFSKAQKSIDEGARYFVTARGRLEVEGVSELEKNEALHTAEEVLKTAERDMEAVLKVCDCLLRENKAHEEEMVDED